MTESIVLWGASGQAKVLAEFLPRLGYQIVAVFDNKSGMESPIAGVPIHEGTTGFRTWREKQAGRLHALVAIGGTNGFDRLSIQRELKESGLLLATVIHPTAFVAGDTILGEGSQILAQSAVCTGARLGKGCIVNTSASVDHESIIGDGVHIAPGAVLAGCVELGNLVFVGPGAVIAARCKIGDNVIVGAGSVVLDDIPPNTLVYGTPARKIRSLPSRQIPQ